MIEFKVETDLKEYDKFINERKGSFIQCSRWPEIKVVWKPYFFCGFRDGERVLACLVLERSLSLCGRIWYTPDGPVTDYSDGEIITEFTKFIKAELKKHGINDCRIYNDGFIVIKAGVGAGAGIGYNCGTGTCCNSIDDNGNMLQVGGFDVLSGDKGNGHWVATQSFRAVYDEICLGKKETLITKLMAEKAGITDRESLLETIAKLESEEAESYIRMFIGSFFEAANSGDEVALEIIDEMAQRGADFTAAHIKKMAFAGETVNVVLSGSMHTKAFSQLYVDALIEKATKECKRNLKFIKLDQPPVTGCINWIFQQYRK